MSSGFPIRAARYQHRADGRPQMFPSRRAESCPVSSSLLGRRLLLHDARAGTGASRVRPQVAVRVHEMVGKPSQAEIWCSVSVRIAPPCSPGVVQDSDSPRRARRSFSPASRLGPSVSVQLALEIRRHFTYSQPLQVQRRQQLSPPGAAGKILQPPGLVRAHYARLRLASYGRACSSRNRRAAAP